MPTGWEGKHGGSKKRKREKKLRNAKTMVKRKRMARNEIT